MKRTLFAALLVALAFGLSAAASLADITVGDTSGSGGVKEHPGKRVGENETVWATPGVAPRSQDGVVVAPQGVQEEPVTSAAPESDPKTVVGSARGEQPTGGSLMLPIIVVAIAAIGFAVLAIRRMLGRWPWTTPHAPARPAHSDSDTTAIRPFDRIET